MTMIVHTFMSIFTILNYTIKVLYLSNIKFFLLIEFENPDFQRYICLYLKPLLRIVYSCTRIIVFINYTRLQSIDYHNKL